MALAGFIEADRAFHFRRVGHGFSIIRSDGRLYRSGAVDAVKDPPG
jgi:hypothetical protein